MNVHIDIHMNITIDVRCNITIYIDSNNNSIYIDSTRWIFQPCGGMDGWFVHSYGWMGHPSIWMDGWMDGWIVHAYGWMDGSSIHIDR